LTANVELAKNTNITSSIQELNDEEPKLPSNIITGGLHTSQRKFSKWSRMTSPRVKELRVLMTKGLIGCQASQSEAR
jgi:hypothetical protein